MEGNNVTLGNYLLQLVDDSDGVGNSLYIYNIGDFVKDVWSELIARGKKINVRKTFPKEFGIEPTHFYAIIKNKRGMSIQSLHRLLELWKLYCNKTDEEVERKWDCIYNGNFPISSFSKCERVNLPKAITVKLSYLMGYLVGDGCFDAHKNHYRVKISETDMDQLERVLKPLISDVFGVKSVVKNEGSDRCNSNFVIINSKPVFRFLRKVLSIKVGEVPRIVKGMDTVNKCYFLRGIFDSEGSVDADYIRSRIRIFQSSKLFLDEIIELLWDVGISANGTYGPHFKYPSEKYKYFSKWYSIEIRKKSEILKFIDIVGSSHPKKVPKLDFLSKAIRSRYKYMSS